MSSIPAAELLFDILIVLHNDVYGTYHITSMFLQAEQQVVDFRTHSAD